MAEHDLGCADLLRGDLVSALAHMDAVRPILIPLSPIGVAITNKDRAEALLAAGMTRSGLSALDDVARTFGHHRLHQRRGETELHRGPRLPAGRSSPAPCRRLGPRGHASSGRTPRPSAGRRLGPRRGGTTASPGSVAGHPCGRPGRGADPPGDAVVGRRLPAGRDAVAIRRGDVHDARRRLASIRVPARAPLAVRLRERDVRAALAERTGRRTDALAHLRRGLADLHEWQSSFGSLDLQTMVTGHGRRLAVRGLRVAVASGRPDVLFEWSERARMLASRVQPVRAPHDEEVWPTSRSCGR